jgi:hypothetical protein
MVDATLSKACTKLAAPVKPNPVLSEYNPLPVAESTANIPLGMQF